MYNLAICYRKGEGINGDLREARKWMKRAALSGHRKAQFEHGLTLFAVSMKNQNCVYDFSSLVCLGQMSMEMKRKVYPLPSFPFPYKSLNWMRYYAIGSSMS